MGCGCGAKAARRPVRSMVKPPSKGVLSMVANANKNATQPNNDENLTDEVRKIQKLRRDAILRALSRPEF